MRFLVRVRENLGVFALGFGIGAALMLVPVWYLASGWLSATSGQARIAETVALR